MVEARARGMSTAVAVRVGTATTGRIITAAALILIVVAGTFVFSDLVMMKYLAFGLITALLLDATVVRMFLVPAVMKMLGDDCWWAPRWMKRLHSRIGLDEMDLRDQRERSEPPAEAEQVLVGAGAPLPEWPRLPRDPTHPVVEGSSRSGAASWVARVARRANTPSAARTAPMPNARPVGAGQLPSAGISVAQDPAANGDGEATASAQRGDADAIASAQPGDGDAPAPAQQQDRKIQSWLGDLGPPRISASRPAGPANGVEPDETTAVPTGQQPDPETP
jgi:RND superfamily putative drug exporter